MGHRQILQRALTTLVTNGAIKRVAGEEELDDIFPRLVNFLRPRAHDHPFAHLHGTACLQATAEIQLRITFLIPDDFAGGAVADGQTYFHQAHAAHANRLQFGMVAKNRNIDAGSLGSIDNHRSFGNGDFYIIYRKRDQIAHASLLGKLPSLYV
jgi:hypothetical protein